MAYFDKISIDGTSYDVKDTATAETVSQQGQTIQQQGQQIQQQGQQIQQQGQQIQQLESEITGATKYKTILDYGAVEGGVQDCSEAILAQISAEGVARIPVGLFLVTQALTLKNCSFIGNYANLSYGYSVTANDSSTIILQQTATIDSFTASNVVFCPNTTSTTEKKAFAAPAVPRACRSLFEKCRFEHWQTVVHGLASFSAYQCTFANCEYAIQTIADSLISSCLCAPNICPLYLPA